MSNNITSPTKVKKYMLEFAKANRAHEFTRVSQDTLDKVEAKVREIIRGIVMAAPSKGKTL